MIKALLCFLLLAAPVQADGWDAARQPGAILLMRHAMAPGTGDPETVVIGDCATQRNLSAQGRAQARQAGQAIRAAGIDVTLVASSQWCRTRETAELLALGPVVDWPALNSHFAGQGDQAGQLAQVLAQLRALPVGAKPLLVTHQVNITALTGAGVASGEVVVMRLDAQGTPQVLGRFTP